MSELKEFLKEYEVEDLPLVEEELHQILTDTTEEVTKEKLAQVKKCQNCKRPFETREESRIKIFVKNQVVCSQCYELVNIGTISERVRKTTSWQARTLSI